MNVNKKIVILYCISFNHYLNFKKIEKKLNADIFYIFETKIIKNTNNNKIIEIKNLEKFLKENKKFISMCIFSTSQLRKFPMYLLFILMINKIRTVSIQETNQMFLHNSRMNNYILPLDFYLLNSNYEKKEFEKIKYQKDSLIVSGWPFFSNNKKQKNRNNILIIFNASNKTNPMSLETNELQEMIMNNLNLYKSNKYKFFVKFHPTENDKYINKLLYKYNKVNILRLKSEDNNFLYNYDYIFLTGYTQLLLEAIVARKKIFILKTQHNAKLIKNYNLNNIDIAHLKEDINYQNIYKSTNYKNLIDDHIHIEPSKAKENIINIINNKNGSIIQNDFNFNELLLWYKIFNYPINLNTIPEIKDSDIYEIIFKNLDFNILRLRIKTLLIKYKNKKIYFCLIILLILNLIKNNQQPNSFEYNNIINLKQLSIINYFFWDYQNFLNLLYSNSSLNNYNKFNIHLSIIMKNYNLILSNKLKFLLNIRKNLFLSNFIILRKMYYYSFKFLTNIKR